MITPRSAVRLLAAVALLAGMGASPAGAADMTADEVRALLAQPRDGKAVSLAKRDLSDLDLSKLDLHGVDLSYAKLFGTRLASADLRGAKLVGANLNGAWVMGADFSGADLTNASMLSLVVVGGDVKARPRFVGAKMGGVRIIAELDGADLTDAYLFAARLGVDIKNQGMGQMRTNLTAAKLKGANLAGADLNRTVLRFADLRGADLRNANLFRADLSGADLGGANVAGADFSEAVLDVVRLNDLEGADLARGLPAAQGDKLKKKP